MKVNELINLLQQHPGELRVVVNGYEDGYDDLSPAQLAVVELSLNTGAESYEGRHGDADHLSGEQRSGANVVSALALCRSSN